MNMQTDLREGFVVSIPEQAATYFDLPKQGTLMVKGPDQKIIKAFYSGIGPWTQKKAKVGLRVRLYEKQGEAIDGASLEAVPF